MAEDETFKVTDRRGRERDIASPEPAPAPAWADAGPGKPDLEALFVMFASSAVISLGEAPDPATGERHVDLDQAREAIDLLILLRDKTQGNRTEHESRLLDQMLYDLQMRFVQASGRAAGA